jgi:hypothetical protein
MYVLLAGKGRRRTGHDLLLSFTATTETSNNLQPSENVTWRQAEHFVLFYFLYQTSDSILLYSIPFSKQNNAMSYLLPSLSQTVMAAIGLQSLLTT